MKTLINLKWHENKWSKDKVTIKEKYIEDIKKGLEKGKVKEVDGMIIHKSGDSYGIFDKETGGTLGFGRASIQEAEKDIPMLLKMAGGKSIQDKKVRKSLNETIDWQMQQENERRKYNDKSFRGEQKNFNESVLDIGAGINPDMRATHAIDLQKPEKYWFDVQYRSGIDLNKDNLPYRNNQFHRVISYSSLGMNFGADKTYKEVYRILKQNGIIEIGLPQGYEKNIKTAVNELTKVGFRDFKTTKKQLPNGGEFTVITGRK